MSKTPTFMLIVAVRTPCLRSLLLQKYYYVRNFPCVTGDMSRLLSSTAVGMTEITCTGRWSGRLLQTESWLVAYSLVVCL